MTCFNLSEAGSCEQNYIESATDFSKRNVVSIDGRFVGKGAVRQNFLFFWSVTIFHLRHCFTAVL
jgi:hypothetical protein